MSTRSAIASVLASVGILVLGWQVGGGSQLAGMAPTTQTTAASATPLPDVGQSSPPGPVAGQSAPADTAAAVGQYVDGSYTGATSANRFGSWTITLTVSGGRIADVQASTTVADRESQQIADRAVPKLTSAVIAAQGAEVNTISGATLTSRSYLDSLQSALDQAAG